MYETQKFTEKQLNNVLFHLQSLLNSLSSFISVAVFKGPDSEVEVGDPLLPLASSGDISLHSYGSAKILYTCAQPDFCYN